MKRALASVLRGQESVAGITHGTVKVSVADVRVEHEVEMSEFAKWLDRPGGSPREMIQRQKKFGRYWVCRLCKGEVTRTPPKEKLRKLLGKR